MSEILKYGCYWDDKAWNAASVELACFRTWRTFDMGGLGRYNHFLNAINALWPETEWNEWMRWRAREFCDIENWTVDGSQKSLFLSQVGCKSAGKTHDWALFGLTWWMADPLNSAFAITSITKEMVKKRSWPVISEHYMQLGSVMGTKVVQNELKIQSINPETQARSDKNAVFALAVKEGQTDKSRQRLAGTHPRRYMVVIDEAAGTPEGIFEAVPNMRANCDEFVFVVCSNGESRMDPHGQCCEPADGWNSIDIDTEKWRTKGVEKWQIDPGICMHFSGRRSPNVVKAKTLYPYIYSYEEYQRTKGLQDTLAYWIYEEGFWAPEGMSNTVFDEATISRYGAMERATFRESAINLAALDPAFGGDDIAFVVARAGSVEQNPGLVLSVDDWVPIRLKHKTKDPVDFQIAYQVKDECQRRGILPRQFALDCTGTGRGVAAILEEIWSPEIVRIEFGGAPTDTPARFNDPRLSAEVYDRRVTQLWWEARALLVAGQLKGLDNETCSQFCKRTYEHGKDNEGRKIKIETKASYKARLGYSPDKADAVTVLVALAKTLGVTATGKAVANFRSNWRKAAIDAQEIYEQGEPGEHSLFAWTED